MKLADQFAKNAKPQKWNYGDRVFAKWEGVPLVGMVIRQNEFGVLIHADLPLGENEGRQVVYCNPKTVKKLVVLQDQLGYNRVMIVLWIILALFGLELTVGLLITILLRKYGVYGG